LYPPFIWGIRIFPRQVLSTDGKTQMREQSVRGCNDLECPLETFKTQMQQFIPRDWARECGLDYSSTNEGERGPIV